MNEPGPRSTDARPPLVILAAGLGERISRRFGDIPKPLVPLAGVTIGERCVRAFAAAGIDEFVVILGHEAGRVRTHFEDVFRRTGGQVAFEEAPGWELGSGASTLAAQGPVGDRPFLVTMADHLLRPDMVTRLLDSPPSDGEIVMAIDRDVVGNFDPDDLTKIRLGGPGGDRVTAHGFMLDPCDAAVTGVFYCTSPLFDALDEGARRGVHSLLDGFTITVEEGRARTVDCTGIPWLDVDTPEAYEEAERRLAAGAYDL